MLQVFKRGDRSYGIPELNQADPLPQSRDPPYSTSFSESFEIRGFNSRMILKNQNIVIQVIHWNHQHILWCRRRNSGRKRSGHDSCNEHNYSTCWFHIALTFLFTIDTDWTGLNSWCTLVISTPFSTTCSYSGTDVFTVFGRSTSGVNFPRMRTRVSIVLSLLLAIN